ncbi:hypothetical protein D3C85_1793800 [compost metagenome]
MRADRSCVRLFSRGADVDGVQAFGSLNNVKDDGLAGFQGFIAIHLYGREMGEEVFAFVILVDKTVTLGIVEPFDLAFYSAFGWRCILVA